MFLSGLGKCWKKAWSERDPRCLADSPNGKPIAGPDDNYGDGERQTQLTSQSSFIGVQRQPVLRRMVRLEVAQRDHRRSHLTSTIATAAEGRNNNVVSFERKASVTATPNTRVNHKDGFAATLKPANRAANCMQAVTDIRICQTGEREHHRKGGKQKRRHDSGELSEFATGPEKHQTTARAKKGSIVDRASDSVSDVWAVIV